MSHRSGPFRVFLSAYVPGAGSGGWLSIGQGMVGWEWSGRGRFLNRQIPTGIVAVRMPVAVLKARLLPPLLNSGLILHGEGGNILVATFWGRHRRTVKELKACGIPIVEVRTNFAFGPDIARRYTWLAD